MKKLRLNNEERELLITNIQEKFEKTGKFNVSSFEYTKKDLLEFLNKTFAKNVKKPTILIDNDTYTKMYELVKQSSIEIQWHMLVDRDLGTNKYLVYDVLLFPQTNSGASTTTDQEEFTEWQTELIMDPEFPLEHLRGHGHSHVNMNVYSSGVDDAYQRDLITKVEDGDYYLFLVLNKKMEMYALLYDFEQQILFETNDMDIEIIDENGLDIKEWAKSQIKEYCKEAIIKPARSYYGPYGKTGTSVKEAEEDLIANINTAGNWYGRRR